MSELNETSESVSLRSIFLGARERKTGRERQAYLDGACGDDHSLRNKVEALLKEEEEVDSFLENPAAEFEDTRIQEGSSEEGPGTVIGRYKILQRIGEGGMGVVYMAEQTEPVSRKIALKIIKLGMDTRQVVARFEAERQALAMMDHPNIAKVLDAGATETGRPYFVMELVRGVPITEYCDRNRLSTRERLELFMPVCQAIQHAHQKGVIHRDIKPTNVMVTLNDGVPHPMVIDFGIAKATHHRLTEKTLFTNFAQIIGTPAYMSPEQAEMSKLDVDTRTDVYSLGVLLYELLTGTTPFPPKELSSLAYGEMQRVIVEKEPPRPSTRLSTMQDEQRTVVARNRRLEVSALGRTFQEDLDWIVMKALEKDRTRRYETANGLAADVRRHLNDEPVTAAAPTFSYQLQKFARRNRKYAQVAVGVTSLLVVALLFSLIQMEKAQNERDRNETLRLEAVEAGNKIKSAQQDLKRELAKSRIDELDARQLLNGSGTVTNALDILKEISDSGIQGLDLPLMRTLALRSFGAPYQKTVENVTHLIPDEDQLSAVHHGDINTVAFGYLDGSIRLFDVFSGADKAAFPEGHRSAIQFLLYLVESDSWVSCDDAGKVFVWNSKSDGKWEVTHRFDLGHSLETPVLVSADPGFLLHEQGSSRIWYWKALVETRPRLLNLPVSSRQRKRRGPYGKQQHFLAVSPDSQFLAYNATDPTTGAEGIQVCVLDEKHLVDHRIQLPLGGVPTVHFSPDGRHLVIGEGISGSNISIYDTSEFQLIYRWDSGSQARRGVAFSKDGKWLFSGYYNKEVFELSTMRRLFRFEGMHGIPNFSTDQQALSSLRCFEGKWSAGRVNFAASPIVQRMDLHLSENGIGFSVNQYWVAASGHADNEVYMTLYDRKSGVRKRLSYGHKSGFLTEDPSFSPDGRFVATSYGHHAMGNTGSGRILIWDTRLEKLLIDKPFGEAAGMVSFHPVKPYIAATMGKQLSVWRYELLTSDSDHPDRIKLDIIYEKTLELKEWHIHWDADGDNLVWTEGGLDNSSWSKSQVRALNPFFGKIFPFKSYITGPSNTIAVTHRPGELLLLTSDSHRIKGHIERWDFVNNRQLPLPKQLDRQNDSIKGSAISIDPTGRYVTFRKPTNRSGQHGIVLFDFLNDKELVTISWQQSAVPFAAQWSPDGKTLGIVGSGEKVEFWDIPEMRRQLAEYNLDWED